MSGVKPFLSLCLMSAPDLPHRVHGGQGDPQPLAPRHGGLRAVGRLLVGLQHGFQLDEQLQAAPVEPGHLPPAGGLLQLELHLALQQARLPLLPDQQHLHSPAGSSSTSPGIFVSLFP